LQAGAPLGLAFSFLLASPLVNEIAVLLLVGLFGIEVTLWYIAMTLAAAIVGGLLIGRLGLTEQVKDVRIAGETDQAVAADGGTVECCAGGSTRTEQTHKQHFASAARDAWSFFVDTLPYLVLGMVIGALIHGVVPVDVLRTVLGPANPLAVPLAALAGAPVYVSLSGMLPIAASLSGQGIAIGTVLAFVIGGAGVSVPNLILLNKLFKRRLLIVYAGTVVTIGVVVGVVFNFFII
jgi:uncharacterized membrane protein YraQ (UPF0718 family)